MLTPDLLTLHRNLCVAVAVLTAEATQLESAVKAAVATFEAAIQADESGAVDLPPEFLPFAAHLAHARTHQLGAYAGPVAALAERARVALSTFAGKEIAQ